MWDERYSGPGYTYGTAPNDFLVAQAGLLRGAVLCLGEGEGRNAVWLAGQGLSVTALDQSQVGLAKAERLAAERGVTITTVAADLAGHDLGEAQWDGIVSIWCHLPAPLRVRVHAAVVRALRPGGVFVLEAYTPAQLAHGTGGPRTVDMLVPPEVLATELQGLSLTVVARERVIHEGALHEGLSAVVQVVGVKP